MEGSPDFIRLLNDIVGEVVDGTPLSIVLGERLDELLSDEKQLVRLLQWVGAQLLGERGPRLSLRERLLLPLAAKELRRRVDAYRSDPTVRREQLRRIKRVWSRKITIPAQLYKMDPFDFEYWVAGYFKRRGYRNVFVTKASNDFGVDVDMYNRWGERIVVQCKRYRGKVGRPVVQQTYGVMHMLGAQRCFVVTSGDFTPKARELERAWPEIRLFNGQDLVGRSPRRRSKRRSGRHRST